jgi:hypothetical protein
LTQIHPPSSNPAAYLPGFTPPKSFRRRALHRQDAYSNNPADFRAKPPNAVQGSQDVRRLFSATMMMWPAPESDSHLSLAGRATSTSPPTGKTARGRHSSPAAEHLRRIASADTMADQGRQTSNNARLSSISTCVPKTLRR